MRAIVIGLLQFTRTDPVKSFVGVTVRLIEYPDYSGCLPVPVALGETLRLGSVLEIDVTVVNT